MSTTITALVTNVERVGATVNGNTVKRVTLSVADDGWPGVLAWHIFLLCGIPII